MPVFSWLVSFLKKEDSPTMVEYGLLILLIAIAVIAGASAFGFAVSSLFEDGADAF